MNAIEAIVRCSGFRRSSVTPFCCHAFTSDCIPSAWFPAVALGRQSIYARPLPGRRSEPGQRILATKDVVSFAGMAHIRQPAAVMARRGADASWLFATFEPPPLAFDGRPSLETPKARKPHLETAQVLAV